METYRTVTPASETSPLPVSRPKIHRQPQGLDGHFIRAQDRHWLGISSPGDGLRIGHDLLAASSRLAKGGHLGQDPSVLVEQTPRGREDRLVTSRGRQCLSTGAFGGAKTGPNPTDRGKNGSKRHLIVDGQGTPLAIEHTGANVHDSEMAIALVDSIPPIKQPRGRPRQRPDEVLADRAYDAETKIRRPLRQRHVVPLIAKRYSEHGSGLGKFRYVVEAAFDWLFNQRRLRVRYEKRDDIHQAFLIIGCFLICWRRIMRFC